MPNLGDAIEKLSHQYLHAIVVEAAEHRRDTGKAIPPGEFIHDTVSISFMSGLHVGVAIGMLDPAALERIRDYLNSEVQENDQTAINQTNEDARVLIEASRDG